MSFVDLFGSTNGDDASLLLDNRSCTDHIPINGAAIDDVEESNQNLADASGDNDHKENPRKRKKKYHRHTPYQIQELESAFKENAHPDEKQRLELRRKLNLESTQIKFWFQNRRTQMKTQSERHENLILKQQNDMLRIENNAIKEAMRNPICSKCGGGELSSEDHQHLLTDNARLKDELNRLYAYNFLASPPLVGPFAGPLMPPNSNLELGVERNGLGGFGPVDGVALLMGHHSGMGVPNPLQQWDLQEGR